MAPIFDVTTALIISFILGIGISATQSEGLKQGFADFGEIIEKITCYSNYSTSSILHPRCIHEHHSFW